MTLDRAGAIADAVLMEGYALYPYRASAPKNRYRWTFGVVAPRAWSVAGGCEPWWLGTELVIAGAPARITGRLRCFQIERRDGWDEGLLRELDFELAAREVRIPFAFDGGPRRLALTGELVLGYEPLDEALGRLSVRVENRTPWTEPGAPRERALAAAFASTHLLVAVEGATIASAIDPPAWAPPARSTGLYPVLVGRADDLVLAAPFIMQDYPALAPESAGDLCDAGEIDELLVLRTRLLTDAEKREARATDPRTAAIVDRADRLPAEQLARMHGATRDLVAGEMVATPAVGSKVRLRMPQRRTDAQDLLYAGKIATVVELRDDVDGSRFLGVTVDDDPAAELHRWYGRCHYYRLDEVDPL